MKTLREEHRAPVGELDFSFRGVPDPFKKCALGISTLLVSTSTLRDVELRHDQRSYGLPMASLFRESKESSDATFFFHSFGVQSEGAQLLPLQEILEKWCEEQRKAIDSVYNGLKDRLP